MQICTLPIMSTILIQSVTCSGPRIVCMTSTLLRRTLLAKVPRRLITLILTTMKWIWTTTAITRTAKLTRKCCNYSIPSTKTNGGPRNSTQHKAPSVMRFQSWTALSVSSMNTPWIKKRLTRSHSQKTNQFVTFNCTASSTQLIDPNAAVLKMTSKISASTVLCPSVSTTREACRPLKNPWDANF